MKKFIKKFLTVFGAFSLAVILLFVLISVFTGERGISLSDKVGVIEVKGVITDSIEISRQIRKYAERDDIKAVVVRIDSPGGAVGPSQEIFRELRKLREVKTVIASMGSVAASGGYYIAVAADRIIANPGTITGSIGVIVELMNVEDLLSKIGLKGSVVKSGRFKDTGSPLREMTAEDKALMQSLVADIHGQFVEAVSEGRSISIEETRRLADGRIFSGAQALKNGLIDEFGSLYDAIDVGAKLAGIKGKPSVEFPEKKFPGILKLLMGGAAEKALGGLHSGMNVLYLARPFQ